MSTEADRVLGQCNCPMGECKFPHDNCDLISYIRSFPPMLTLMGGEVCTVGFYANVAANKIESLRSQLAAKERECEKLLDYIKYLKAWEYLPADLDAEIEDDMQP